MRIDISDQMTDSFYITARKGQVLGFRQDDKIKHYRIVRLNRTKKICEVIETKLHDPKEADEILKSDLTLDDVLKEFEGIKLSTTEDVMRVLTWIGPPGKNRELKTAAVKKLFRGSSPQDYSTVDSLDGYEEF